MIINPWGLRYLGYMDDWGGGKSDPKIFF
jgi:hypothetical protein